MAIKRTLGPDEHVVLEMRTHAKALFGAMATLVVVLAVVVAAVILLPENDARGWLLIVVGVLAAVAVVAWVLVPFLRWRTTTYTFTNRRLVTRTGILTRTGRDIPLFRINDLTYEKHLSDRLFGCGTIVVSDATEKAGVKLHDVPNVEAVQRQLSALIFQADDGTDDGERPPGEPRRR